MSITKRSPRIWTCPCSSTSPSFPTRKNCTQEERGPGEPVMQMKMFTFNNVVIQENLQGKGTKPVTWIMSVFVNRGDEAHPDWKICLSAQTRIKKKSGKSPKKQPQRQRSVVRRAGLRLRGLVLARTKFRRLKPVHASSPTPTALSLRFSPGDFPPPRRQAICRCYPHRSCAHLPRPEASGIAEIVRSWA